MITPPPLSLSAGARCGSTRTARVVAAFLVAALSGAAPTSAAAQTVRIGVVAPPDQAQLAERWISTTDYLAAALPALRFETVMLSASGFGKPLADGRVDFIIAAPAEYAVLERNHDATRLLTLRTVSNGFAVSELGAIIFVRGDRRDLQTLADLKGKSFAATSRASFDGYLLAWRELQRAGVDPARDLSRLDFLESKPEDVVAAVLEGRVDAGTVRSGVREHLIAAGSMAPGAVRVLNVQAHAGFPFVTSTPLYPEWAFARLPHTSGELARTVTLALLQMGGANPAVRVNDAAGWTRPQDYTPVHELLRELRLPPYAGIGGARWWLLVREHWVASAALAAALLALSALVFHLVRLTRRLRASERKLLEIREQLEASNAVLQQRSTVDGLTGVANRRVFDETLACEWARAMRGGHSIAVILADIDHFKRHNDQYGHQAGDECLRAVARTLAATVKRTGDLVARYGGEEFAVILPNADGKGATAVAERLRVAVEQIRLAHVGSVTGRDVTISLGVAATVPVRGASPRSLIEAADAALYQAKAVGRNQVIVAQPNAAAA